MVDAARQDEAADGGAAGVAAGGDCSAAVPKPNVRSNWKEIALRGLRRKVAENKPLRSPVGTKAIMDGDALGCLPVSLSSRRRLFLILNSQPYEAFKCALIAAHLVVLALDEPSKDDAGIEAANVAIVAIYTTELMARIFSQGLVRGRNTYLRNSYFGVLEFVDVVVSWALIVVRASNGDEPFVQLSALRAYRMLLVFKSFRTFSAVYTVLEALASSATLVVDLFMLCGVFFTFFALMGQLLFMGSLRRRCVAIEATGCTEVADGSGAYECASVLPVDTQLAARLALATPAGVDATDIGPPLLGFPQSLQFCADAEDDKGRVCDTAIRRWDVGSGQPPLFTTQTCARVDNLNGGFSTFDSFPGTVLTMFQAITLEGWQDVMFATVDAEYDASASYFVFLIILITFFFVSVFVAAISGVFLRLRREHQLVLERRRRKGDAGASERSLKRVQRLLGIAGAGSMSRKGSDFADGVGDEEGDALASVFAKAMAAKRKRDAVFHKPALIRPQISAALAAFVPGAKVSPAWAAVAESPRGATPAACFDAQDSEAAHSARAHRTASLVKTSKGTDEKVQTLWDRLVVRAFILINHTRYFDHFSALCIVLNVIAMGMHEAGTSDDAAATLTFVQRVFLVIFAFEQALRMVGAGGLFEYFTDQFPLALVDAAWLVLGAVGLATGAFPNFTVFRALLIFRFYPSKVLGKVSRNFTTLLSTVLFYLFTCFVCALLAMELYGREYPDVSVSDPSGPYRRNFDTIGESCLTMLQVSTGEDWNKVLYETMGASENSWFAPFFLAVFFCFSNYVLLNLIIAVILENMELQDAEKVRLQQESHDMAERARRDPQRLVGFVGFVEKLRGNARSKIVPTTIELPAPGQGAKGVVSDATSAGGAGARRDCEPRRQKVSASRMHEISRGRAPSVHRMSVTSSSYGVRTVSNVRTDSQVFGDLSSKLAESSHVEISVPAWAEDTSLWIFDRDSTTRSLCRRVLAHRWYQFFISCTIALSIAGVIMTKPVGLENDLDSMIAGINVVVFLTFSVDFALKVVDKGFLLTPAAYMHDEYHVIDLVVLAVDGLSLLPWGDYLLRAIRMSIALRPARLLGHTASIREVFSSLLKSIPGIVPVFLVGFVLFGCFAIFGMHSFRGRLSACNDGDVPGRFFCTGVYANNISQWSEALEGSTGVAQGGAPLQVLVPRVWSAPDSNFDTLGSAFFTVFQVASLDGWVDVMHSVMDSRGEGLQPQHNAAWWAAFYFVALVIVGSFYIVRVFVAVFIDQFSYINGSKLLTERQKLWRDMHRFACRMKPERLHRRPQTRAGALAYDLLHSPSFGPAMMCTIIANVALMATTTYDQERWRDDMLRYADLFFVVVYALEACARALEVDSWRMYFKGWNVFELVIVVGSTCTLGLWAEEGSTLLKIGRPFRFLRAFRVIRFSGALDNLFNTLVITFPAVFNVASLLMIVMFFFAGIAVQLFNNVRYGLYLTHQANYSSFPRAFMLLFQLMTGEGWVGIMGDSRVGPPHCSPAAPVRGGTPGEYVNECGFQTGGRIFYCAFVLCCAYIFLNLFVAVVLDTVTFGLLKERAIITTTHLTRFRKEWAHFDPDATGTIPHYQVREFVLKLGAPLGPPTDDGKPRPTWLMRLSAEVHRMKWTSGVPFLGLIELLMLMRLNKNALTLDARIEREKVEKSLQNTGATLTIQRYARGTRDRAKSQKLREAKACEVRAAEALQPPAEAVSVQGSKDRNPAQHANE